MCIIRIGGDAEYLHLTIQRRSYPEASDPWDGNWLDCTAEVVVGAFTGSLERSLRIEELNRFGQGLRRLNDQLTGEATLESMEHWVRVQLVGDGRGHIDAHCRLCDHSAFGNSLDFQLSLDQTYLPALLRQVVRTLEMFPAVGR